MRRASAARAMILVTLVAVAGACAPGAPPTLALPSGAPTDGAALSLEPGETVTLLAAGDIARCDADGDEATAALLDENDGIVLALGDLAYDDGTPEDFARCYGPTWGRHRDRTLPVIGNHEYERGSPVGYLGYFGRRAIPEDRTWYAHELGTWDLIVLDGNCHHAGGCGPGSEQLAWLEEQLNGSDATCTLVAIHQPRWSSGEHGNEPDLDPIWRALHAGGADLVLSAHDHHYERFAPMDPAGTVDRAGGIRSFVVGTGGGEDRRLVSDAPNWEARDHDTLGVLRVTLDDASYAWRFLPVAGMTFTDQGSDRCH